MTIQNLVKLLKENFKCEVYRQGSLPESVPYPDRFFTYRNTSSDFSEYSDNTEKTLEVDISLYFYSRSLNDVFETLSKARDILKKEGWLCPTAGTDTPTDDPDYSARMIKIIKEERNI